VGDCIGSVALADELVEDPPGVYAEAGLGWFACSWSERRGPYRSRELAESELIRMNALEPGLAETWMDVAKMVAGGLLCSSIMLAGLLVLTMVVCLVRWWSGLL